MAHVPLQLGFELTTRTITAGGIAAVVVLVGLSAFFSSSEIAMFSLADHRVEAMVQAGHPGASLVSELRSDPHRLLVTILVGNNVVNIAMASVSTTVLALHFPPAESVVIATFGITALVLLFGESAPKSYAVEHPESWARRVARPLQLSAYLMYPLVVLFDALTRVVNRLTGAGGGDGIEAPYVTRRELQQLIETGEREGVIEEGERELQQLIETGEREGVIEEGERELLLGIFQFRNRIAKEIMKSRLDVTAVEAHTTVGDAIDVCVRADRDRIPVYEGTLDTVVGIAELTDLVGAARDDPGTMAADVAVPAVVIPETKEVDELLVEMREDGRHMAIVVDEFGTTQGLITLEDILEEIVGEILEEAERPPIEVAEDGTARVRGDANVHEVNEALDVSIPEGETFETIAGFVFARLGRIPAEGDAVTHDGVRIEVERMDNTRIRTLRVTKPDGSPEAPTGPASDER